jgi:hypothetical protein
MLTKVAIKSLASNGTKHLCTVARLRRDLSANPTVTIPLFRFLSDVMKSCFEKERWLFVVISTLRDSPTRFLPPIFSQMGSSQAPYSVFKDFSNLASNSMRYSRFFIDSPLLFTAESLYSPYCLLQTVATLRIILAGSHYLL